MIQRTSFVLALLLGAVMVSGCGDENGGGGGDAGVTDGPPGLDGPGPDATVPPGCSMEPDAPQCNNCLDDDNDGTIDGFDIECTGATDDDEGTFATGIPGDNQDTVKQDCFFDGNSGSGDDGCEIHVCCLLGAPDQASCPYGPNQYDPASCDDPQSDRCRMNCFDLTPPGCDCFGCCTVCDPTTDLCRDVVTNPATAPNCDATTINDPVACPACTKVETCNNPCDPEGCILCPGQTPDDLPDTCSGQECPTGSTVCGTGDACPEGEFCIGGCCIAAIP